MTDRTEHIDDAGLHDLLDGELDLVGERAAQAHLRSCDRCASRLAELSLVVEELAGLPAAATPARDLWPDIASRVGGGAKVLAFPETGDAATGTPAGAPASGSAVRDPKRRVSFSMPQLWAAGIAVALVSGGAVWFALGAGDPTAGASVATSAGGAARVEAPDVLPRARVRNAGDAYEQAVTDLEAILEAGRDVLDPATIRTIEESLAAIDDAIAEAEAALAEDPGSELLHRLLLQHQRTKLRMLRQATAGLGART